MMTEPTQDAVPNLDPSARPHPTTPPLWAASEPAVVMATRARLSHGRCQPCSPPPLPSPSLPVPPSFVSAAPLTGMAAKRGTKVRCGGGAKLEDPRYQKREGYFRWGGGQVGGALVSPFAWRRGSLPGSEREGWVVGDEREWVSITQLEETDGEVKDGEWRLGRPQARATA